MMNRVGLRATAISKMPVILLWWFLDLRQVVGAPHHTAVRAPVAIQQNFTGAIESRGRYHPAVKVG
jgi:hypothetical protein